jgi:DNA-binding response OmpR family regulator
MPGHYGPGPISRAKELKSMKENVVLLVDADGDSVGIVLEAAARTGHTARLAKTSREAFEILKRDIRRLDIVIIDVDPGAHGLALLEAISGCAERPPIIVVTALEETYMKPIAAEHGAAACLGKPIRIEKLRSTLDAVSARRSQMLTSDRWGFLIPPPVRKRPNAKSSFRGIAAKLSPIGAEKKRAATQTRPAGKS